MFIAGYREERLSTFDSRKFVELLGTEARTVALFYVEREPAACHRSLLADKLQRDLGAACEVVHLRPKPAGAEGAGNCSGLGSAPAPGAAIRRPRRMAGGHPRVAGEGASHGTRGGRAPQT